MTVPTSTIPDYSGPMPDALYIPAPLGGTNDRMLAAFADALRGQTIEGFHIYDALVASEWFRQTGTFIEVRVLLADPPDGADLWPAEQALKLSLAIDRMAWEHAIIESTVMRYTCLRDPGSAAFPAETVAQARAAAQSASSDPGR